MITIQEVLLKSQTFLRQKGVPNPRREAEEIVSICLNRPRIELYTEFEKPLLEEELQQIRAYLKRRANREPLQYIQGFVDFYGSSISLQPTVLIPRQETEILVDKIVQELKSKDLQDKVLWDVCTGSGAIAIALKKSLPQLAVLASDLSDEALKVASENAQKNNVSIKFKQGSLLEPFSDLKVDFIVSNPPYISDEEYQALEPEVKEYEPKMSLVAGSTGIEMYQKLALSLKNSLKSKAKVWLEIGYQQGKMVREIFKQAGFDNVRFEKDYSGKDRFFFLELE